jgi:hypothetical protein
MSKAQLYNDLHPDKSLKNTGFKDSMTAIRTINLISKRSLRYQYDVINTMYYRAKYHPYITDDMKKAMVIFKKWLKNYKKIKALEDKKYPWLSLKTIAKYEKIADLYGVSMVTRGYEKSTRTDSGFLQMYKDVEGKANKLQYIPVKKNKPEGQDYYSYRISFLNSRMGQIKHGKTPLYYTEGKFKGMPTKQHIILIMHAYSPDKSI